MKKIDFKNKKVIVISITAVSIILVIFISILIILHYKKKNEIKIETEIYSEEMMQVQENAILEEQERKIQEEKEAKRFNPLNEEELEKMSKIYGHSDTKRVFLTFDDGPTKQVTPYILDLLKQENIKATFFVLGNRVEANKDLVKREYEEGHFIGSHGYSHKYSAIYESLWSCADEYNKTNELIRSAIGKDNYNALVFRFPGGSVGGPYNDLKKEAVDMFKNSGVASLDWNALTGDAEGATTKEKMMEYLYDTTQEKTSVVLLMHDSADKILTYETLPDIIGYFRDNGYQFQTVYDVIGRD